MQFGNSIAPQGWQQLSLEDICLKITSGGTPNRKNYDFYNNGKILWVKTKELNNYFIHDTEEKITKDALNKSSAKLLPKDTILLAMYGATVGELGILSKEMACNQACCALIINPKIADFRFVFYLLKLYKEKIKGLATGAAQQNLSTTTIKGFTFNFPPLLEQQKIADFLFGIDDKIQLNTQTNQTLEQIAQAIYKSWFVDYEPTRAKAAVLAAGGSMAEAETAAMTAISGKTAAELAALKQHDPARYQQLADLAAAFPAALVPTDDFGEIPAGWEAATLGEICDMKNGYAFKSADWTESGIPVIKIGSVKPMLVEVEGNGFVDANFATSKPEFLVQPGDILVGLTGYVGEVGRMPHGRNAMLNQRVAKFVPKKIDSAHTYYNFVYCLARQDTFKRFAEGNAKGSAQANISTKELLKYPTVIADSTIHKAFESFTAALMEKILLHSSISWQLAKARDLLLPKLLNGEI